MVFLAKSFSIKLSLWESIRVIAFCKWAWLLICPNHKRAVLTSQAHLVLEEIGACVLFYGVIYFFGNGSKALSFGSRP